ncbi:uncharacterized protein TRIADDRAFT_59540 [Trichoplax adhaerens]|uniref:Uncharacterized protein n=1 Tax=Trichoplax adhaerens TaxID=10228 RepID=B3S5X4_TRIAD|nr:predicted protein [Trichoplax adhaerens]EDV21885.1 predicted protein [Trichoplax adhaerens]|eukprot:XP_002115522.1 predicted protein [Trichoplax adhaerens]
MGGYRWQSGKLGPLASHPHQILEGNKGKKTTTRQRKLKMLRDEDTMDVVKSERIEKFSSDSDYKSDSSPIKDLHLSSGQSYDSIKQTSLPLRNPDKSPSPAQLQSKIPRRIGLKDNMSTSYVKPKINNISYDTKILNAVKTNSLLYGNYDEKESANSFQQALLEWRSGSNSNKSNPPTTKKAKNAPTSVGITVNSILARPEFTPEQIKFKRDNLSYMERLMLKKLRKNRITKLDVGQNETKSSPTSRVSSPEPKINLLSDEPYFTKHSQKEKVILSPLRNSKSLDFSDIHKKSNVKAEHNYEQAPSKETTTSKKSPRKDCTTITITAATSELSLTDDKNTILNRKVSKYTGLSGFFLAGLEDGSADNGNKENDVSQSIEGGQSTTLKSGHWKPPSNVFGDKPEYINWGINDYLNDPVPRSKSPTAYMQVHRVSSTSPLPLDLQPPNDWSDEEDSLVINKTEQIDMKKVEKI